MSWLLVSWFLSFGLVPLQTEIVYQGEASLDKEYMTTVAQIGIEATLFKRLTLFGNIENFQYFDKEGWQDGGAFFPYRIDYTAGAIFHFNKWIYVTAIHECDHPVKYSSVTYSYMSSETKVFITLKGETTW